MQVLNVQSIKQALSTPRMQSYSNFFLQSQLDGTLPRDKEAIYLQLWSNEVAESFWRLISFIEISLRNNIHSVLSDDCFLLPKKRVINRENIHNNNYKYMNVTTVGNNESSNWFEAINFNKKVLQLILDRTHTIKKNGNMFHKSWQTPDDVIAGLTFGFWRFIFKNLKSANYNYLDVISKTFKNAPFGGQEIKQSIDFKIDCRLEMIHGIRNRISHHEPVWKLKEMLSESMPTLPNKYRDTLKVKPTNAGDTFIHLMLYYNQMIEFLYWINKDLSQSYQTSWWHKRFNFLCSQKGLDYYFKSYKLPNIISSSVLKREMNKVMRSSQGYHVINKNREYILTPVK
ncbi:Abi family protein [Yersinia enterocolitica]|uniref:Abi family protein n=2 Tax=Yersinia enterocolitica TaxID=630 RepID=UPI003AB11421